MSDAAPPTPTADTALVFSCEHATFAVPERWRELFAGHEEELTSHRGWDPGAAWAARRLAQQLEAPLALGACSRLLVDLNRTPGKPGVFSSYTHRLPLAERQALLDEYHHPHHDAVRAQVDAALSRSARVLHLSVHSFTPVWEGVERPTQLGLLDDPKRTREREISLALQAALRARHKELRVHLNQPYRGWTDGLITRLRKVYPEERYAGLELEFNQALLPADASVHDPRAKTRLELAEVLVDSLAAALHETLRSPDRSSS